MNRPPNIILVLADDMGYSDSSAYDGWIPTPRMERMAAEGMRFTDFHSNGAVCSPTRAALLTGRYQQRVGIEDVLVGRKNYKSYYRGLDSGNPTFSSMLKAAGYKTALFGKWHLGHLEEFNPIHHGFDEFRGYLTGAIDYVSHWHVAEFDWWNGLEHVNEEGYTTHLITDHSVRFIEQNKDQPFCLFVSHEAVHLPFQAPGDPAQSGPNSVPPKPYKEMTRDDIAPKYIPMTQELDTGLGKVLDAVDRCGLTDNTLVIFFSDNGGISWIGSNAPCRGFKADLWEGGHRVPAIARWPGRIPEGVVCDQTAMGMDLLPTMMELAGVPLPGDRKFDGVSLGGLLCRNEQLEPRQLFWGYERRGTAMRDGDWKFITKPDNAELYDLSADIGEENNLADEHPERVAEMMSAIDAWSADVRSEHPIDEWQK